MTETVLRAFHVPSPRGAYASQGVIRDSSGTLYGATQLGGTVGGGVLYKVTPSGKQTVLYNFTLGDGGNSPLGTPVGDSAGNLYGTALGGGTHNAGVVFKYDLKTGQETVLYNFTGGTDGGYPFAGVTLDAAGNLYGTTGYGGAHAAGTVYMVDPSGNETVLYSFTSGADGYGPTDTPIRDSAGNLYGTSGGGAFNQGVVFKLDPSGNLTVLYSFTGGADGGDVPGGLARDQAGNLYGATIFGGGPCGGGVVFKVDPSGNETTLYTFNCGADGGYPESGVSLDSSGNVYGTASSGGINPCGCGVVFKVDPQGNETVLYSFLGGNDGANPDFGVILDASGNLYGTTPAGGPANAGTVYELATDGTETVLCNFPSPPAGSNPYQNLIRDAAGNFYGITSAGGANDSGVVYKLDSSGNERVLYTFTGQGDQASPQSLVRDSAGNLYGTTYYFPGIVFELQPSGQFNVLHTFGSGPDGSLPTGELALDSQGNLYGTTEQGGGSANAGTIYKVDPAGNETILYAFTGGTDGGEPIGGVILDSTGNLYGTTYSGGAGNGVVFMLGTSGVETVLYTFTGKADGGKPYASLIRDANGNLYGTASAGGKGNGVVFKLDTTGKETVLHAFAGAADGAGPTTGLIQDPAGNLYGTTANGGAENAGVAYEVTLAGQETVLYTFLGGTDGANPAGSLVRDTAGNLYGAASNGGTYSGGVVFELKPQ